MSHELDLHDDDLVAQFQEIMTPEIAYTIERLLHTYVGNPVTGIFTQVEIIKRTIERKPENLEDEIMRLQDQVRRSSDNIVTIVKALAAAFPHDDSSTE